MFWEKHGIAKKDLLVPASILVGAILVSASIGLSSGGISWGGSEAAVVKADAGAAQNDGTISLNKRKDAPTIGTGKLEIVEFSDFQCPFCQKFYNGAYKEIKTKYIDTGKAKIVFRHMPLPFHTNAQKAAEAAECAARQGQFPAYHDILFAKMQSDGTGLAPDDLKKYAADLGLNTQKFNSCLDKGEAAEAVKKDVEDAKAAGITGTPSFVIDGKKVVGAQPFANFEAAIEEALK